MHLNTSVSRMAQGWEAEGLLNASPSPDPWTDLAQETSCRPAASSQHSGLQNPEHNFAIMRSQPSQVPGPVLFALWHWNSQVSRITNLLGNWEGKAH